MKSGVLSRQFKEMLKNAFIASTFTFDPHHEDYEHCTDPDNWAGLDPVWSNEEYRIYALGLDWQPLTVVLTDANGDFAGIYMCPMCFVEDQHRGKGLAARMIAEFGWHYGEYGYNNEYDDLTAGIGFTEGGYAAHESAALITKAESKARRAINNAHAEATPTL